MKVVPDNKTASISKPEIEQVQKEKQEYKLISSFVRTKGLNLYGYDSYKDEIYLVEQDNVDTIHWNEANELVNKYTASIDSRHTFFEALNMKSAINRVKKWKQGKKELDNLKYSDGKIDILNP